MRGWLAAAILLLAACSGAPKKPDAAPASPTVAGQPHPQPPAGAAIDCSGFVPYPAAQEDLSTRGDYVAGGLYKPGVRDSVPDYLPNVACIPEPTVVHEPPSRYGNRSPYTVLGRAYHVRDSAHGFVETGIASYYGNKFHGRRTSNQEVYDMYAFTAAHKSLPLPSYARVTNLDNGRSIVVRVNDRGPFHEGRVIDLSYAAAVKLDIHRQGTGRVEVRGLAPGDVAPVQLASAQPAVAAPSGMDGLVGALPTNVPATAAVAPAPATADTVTRAADHPEYGKAENRFELVKDGRVRTADEFDAWMRERHARLDATATTGASQVIPVAATSPAVVAPSSPAPSVAAGLTLQVGVFSQRGNADRVLATLQGAGIPAAHVQDASNAGRALWRVRVGQVAQASLAEVTARIAALGLGTPQLVRE
ncbi:MAG: septal ring lytic transglycosylase RlpA family protein [Luteimonas sp.]|nr:septal ring lytic transglycosylase RlpA family protein [Luteimonas sp.]